MLESLHTFTDDYRNTFDEVEATAKEVLSVSNVCSCFSTQHIRHFDEVEESAVVLQGRDKFRVETVLVIVNQLHTALRGEDLKRITKYVSTVFKVVTEFKDLTNDVIRQLAFTMANTYAAQIYSLAHFRMRWFSL